MPGLAPRFLLITRNLPPLLGGMERLNLHMAEALAAQGVLTVIGPTGCREYLSRSATVIEVPPRPLWRFLLGSVGAAWKQRRNDFDVVVAGSGLTALQSRLVARRSGARSVVYVHGLDLTTRNLLYRMLWRPALRKHDRALANSANTADIAARLGVARGRVSVLHPGVELPDPSRADGVAFRERFDLGSGPLLLSVGRMTRRKGLIEFVQHSFPSVLERHPDARLVVIGDEAPDALQGSGRGSTDRIRTAGAEKGLLEAIRFLGTCDDPTLSAAYFAASVHVFPVREVPGDIEGFGMVAMEAAAHGLPTVAFAVGGVPDAVAHERTGLLVPPGEYGRFADAVCRFLEPGSRDEMKTSAMEVARAFAWSRFGSRLRAILDEIPGGEGAALNDRRGHAVLNLRSRSAKARKIESLLGLEHNGRTLRILEVGTGSGGIAHYFGTHPTLSCDVDTVDVEDSRQIREGYRFTKVDDVALPFADCTFDVVITNHVIEHVGDAQAQQLHLKEVNRVLKNDGIGYLAVPNRWQLVEPHYKLAFLSWLPVPWRTPYLRWRNRGDVYDCRPLTVPQVERHLNAAGFSFEQQHARALRLTFQLERPDAPLYRWLLRFIPDRVYGVARRLFPTLIFTLSKSDESTARSRQPPAPSP